ncbi:MAG: 3'-5' exoribonuclease [Flavobacteriales bacterium]|nr:3'-5' exoribonuclease [Flavobacteriales bacterium]
MKFAIVDIETTGLFHQGHGITEVAVVGLEDGKIEMLFQQLFNPGRDIPISVEAITGISRELIADKGHISDALDELTAVLEDRIFVAHNANFDYQFLKAVFEKEKYPFKRKRLCTLRYARKMYPELKSHRLDVLCDFLGIQNVAKHRAFGDAMATARLLLHLMSKDEEFLTLKKLLGRSEHHIVLPSNLDERDVIDLPERPGVYYMFGLETKPLYIGKAKSLKKRVLSHFTASGSSRRKQLFQRLVHRVEFKETSSEYHALLLEDAEIKKYWPKLNRAQKEKNQAIAVVPYEDRTGAKRLAMVRQPQAEVDVLSWFNSLHSAKNWLCRCCLEYGIDPARAGLPAFEEIPNYDRQEEAEALESFIQKCFSEKKKSYVLLEQTSRRFALVTEGRYRGFGEMKEKDLTELEEFEKAMRPARDSPVARAVVRTMLADEKIKKIDL